MNIRYGQKRDLGGLIKRDDVSEFWINRCLKFNEYVVAELESKIVGFLRYSLFWGKIPYMDMIRVDQEFQKQGIGTELFNFWQDEMQKRNFRELMTSATKDEKEPQDWHLRNGFDHVGEIDFGEKEVFMIKRIKNE